MLKFIITPFVLLIIILNTSAAQGFNPYFKKEHLQLNEFRGTWKVLYNVTPPYEKSYAGKGIASAEYVLDSSYVEINSTMEYLYGNFSLKIFLGYDADKEKYSLFSIDQTGSDPAIAYGDYDENQKQYNFSGTTKVNDRKLDFKINITFERDDKFFYEYWLFDEGKWQKTLEYAFIRS